MHMKTVVGQTREASAAGLSILTARVISQMAGMFSCFKIVAIFKFFSFFALKISKVMHMKTVVGQTREIKS